MADQSFGTTLVKAQTEKFCMVLNWRLYYLLYIVYIVIVYTVVNW